jgi:hypothetical protein
VDLCPWADAVYGCDAAWWKYRNGLPEFGGLKISWAGNGLTYPDIKKVEIVKTRKGRELYSDDFHITGNSIGGGGNSGFQALNMAVLLFGARNFALVGFDMHDRGGKHWYGRNIWPQANNPQQSNFSRWMRAFDAALPKLTSIGAVVVNCSQGSALKTFPFQSIENALKDFYGEGAVDMAGV